MKETVGCWLALKVEGNMERGMRPLGVESEPGSPSNKQTGLGSYAPEENTGQRHLDFSPLRLSAENPVSLCLNFCPTQMRRKKLGVVLSHYI